MALICAECAELYLEVMGNARLSVKAATYVSKRAKELME